MAYRIDLAGISEGSPIIHIETDPSRMLNVEKAYGGYGVSVYIEGLHPIAEEAQTDRMARVANAKPSCSILALYWDSDGDATRTIEFANGMAIDLMFRSDPVGGVYYVNVHATRDMPRAEEGFIFYLNGKSETYELHFKETQMPRRCHTASDMVLEGDPDVPRSRAMHHYLGLAIE